MRFEEFNQLNEAADRVKWLVRRKAQVHGAGTTHAVTTLPAKVEGWFYSEEEALAKLHQLEQAAEIKFQKNKDIGLPREEFEIEKTDLYGTPIREDEIAEVAPPGMEDWIKDRKADFKKRYGDKWESVLYATAWKRHKNESIKESHGEDSPVANAIIRRIMMQHPDLLQKYGPEKIMQAVDDQVAWVGDVEEIGSSDVSIWVKDVERSLADMNPDLEEASLATMRDYFAGDENARDPYEITKQRLHFAKDKTAGQATQKKEFRSKWEYEQWLAKQGKRDLTQEQSVAEEGDASEYNYDNIGNLARRKLEKDIAAGNYNQKKQTTWSRIKRAVKGGITGKDPGVQESDGNLSVGELMAQDGIVYSPEREKEIIRMVPDYMKKAGYSSKDIRYYFNYDEDFIPDVLSDLPRESVGEAALDPSGLIAAAQMVQDYIVTAEVDGAVKKFRVRGMTGLNAAKERFLKHHSMAKVVDVKPEQGVAEGSEEKEEFKPWGTLKKPQPYHDPDWMKKIPQKELDGLAGRNKKTKNKDMAEGARPDDKFDGHEQAEWDEKMARLKKLAGQGELKTVWDPVKRVYKNIPVNQDKE